MRRGQSFECWIPDALFSTSFFLLPPKFGGRGGRDGASFFNVGFPTLFSRRLFFSYHPSLGGGGGDETGPVF